MNMMLEMIRKRVERSGLALRQDQALLLFKRIDELEKENAELREQVDHANDLALERSEAYDRDH